ncbi:MAG: hypothetical protein R3B68_03850 [Phycisphaerales bacterium]
MILIEWLRCVAWWDWIKTLSPSDVLQTVSLCAVAAGIVFAVRQFRLTSTLGYMHVFSNPTVIAMRTKVDAWLASTADDAQRLKEIERDIELQTALRLMLSVFSQIGVAYHYGVLSRRIARAIFNPLVPTYYGRLKFYIEAQRARKVLVGYFFEYLAQEIERHPRVLPRRMRAVPDPAGEE